MSNFPGEPSAESLLADLFASGNEMLDFNVDDEVTQELLLPSEELGRVARRIAGQYVAVLAHYAAAAFGRTQHDGALQVRNSVDALSRLAHAAEDAEQLALLAELEQLLEGLEAPRRSRTARRSVSALSSWIPRFAETLEPEDAASLLDLIRWEKGTMPLLDELATIRGIGHVRLSRLYAAGLFSIDVVANAAPEEIVQVTGLPRALAEEVVQRTRRFAEDERRRCLEEMKDRALRLQTLVKTIRFSADDPLAAEAMAAVEQALLGLAKQGGGR
ncbi:MAG: hypothetical protein H6738_24035 [Alphaproteobacteria bacterium]|nr:hypothetical protein [Alphaproteobacteria bacterium]MCB9699879.1 hypothetical protein [Alphaproteobacteria bacterium]